MSTREKWLTVLVCLCILILCSGFGLFRKKTVSSGITKVSELKGRTLGGVESRMPANSAKIFFESMLGVKLAGYKAYNNMDEALCALNTGEVAAIWTTDVTADYLTGGEGTDASEASKAADNGIKYRVVDTHATSGIMQLPEGRFEFGFAVKNDEYGEKLITGLNSAIAALKAGGVLDELTCKYIYEAHDAERFSVKDMVSQTPAYRQNYEQTGTLVIGITGAVPPVELIDANGQPYGFCAAFTDEIAQCLGICVELKAVDNETAFTGLMSGGIDAVMCYGTPGRITTEGTRKWLMSDGYLPCAGYQLISVETE